MSQASDRQWTESARAESSRVIAGFGGAVTDVEMHRRVDLGREKFGPEGIAVRVVPLLFVSASAPMRSITVGHTLVEAGTDGMVIETRIQAAWHEETENEFSVIASDDESLREDIRCRVEAYVGSFARKLSTELGPDIAAAEMAKSLAEAARNSVAAVREIRYALEESLAESSHASKASDQYTDVIAALLQLNIVCGRGSDQSREAVREGLWVHATDSEAYHAYRKLQDPTLISTHAPATPTTKPWMRAHDAAMRQCQEMCRQLEKESESIRTLLTAASSISGSREADAQARFNLLVALLSIGLGIPALFLTMYGTNLLLPMNTWPKVGAFVPVGIALLASGAAAIRFAPKGARGRVWLLCGAAVLGVLVLMIVAAVLAPVSLT